MEANLFIAGDNANDTGSRNNVISTEDAAASDSEIGSVINLGFAMVR